MLGWRTKDLPIGWESLDMSDIEFLIVTPSLSAV
jgi:hypothetical protein